MTTYLEYKSRIVKSEDYKKVVEDARTEYVIKAEYPPHVYTRIEIPFNLEREYFDSLVDESRFMEAQRIINRMRLTYTDADLQNLIEQYEYRLHMTLKAEKMLQERLTKAEGDFRDHTFIILSVVVGVITIFGTANQSFVLENFDNSLRTFKTISGAIILLIAITFVANIAMKKYTK